MKFIAYGCSYTQGIELADTFLTNMSDDRTEKLKAKHGHNWVDRLAKHTSKETQAKYENIMAHRSYAGIISKILPTKQYINRARSGNSNASMYFDLAADLHNGKINQDDVVLVGLTSADRLPFWVESKYIENGLPTGGWWPSPKLKKETIIRYNDNDWLTPTITAVRGMQHLMKDHKNFFLQTVHYPFTEIYKQFNLNDTIWQELKSIQQECVLPESCIWKVWDGPTPQHTFFHPRAEVAKKFGSIIGNEIKQRIKSNG